VDGNWVEFANVALIPAGATVEIGAPLREEAPRLGEFRAGLSPEEFVKHLGDFTFYFAADGEEYWWRLTSADLERQFAARFPEGVPAGVEPMVVGWMDAPEEVPVT
jgi:hypothetical protein